MTSKFECEVRFLIHNIEEFERRLRSLNARLLFPYEFIDYYFKPKSSNPWDPQMKTLRLREWITPKKESEVLFTRTETVERGGILFKRSVYPDGKVKLMKGSSNVCRKFLSDLGFEEWFRIVKKECKLFEIPKPNFKTVYEYVEGLGWSGELEVGGSDVNEAAKNLKDFLSVLKIRRDDVRFEPLSKIYAEKFNF
jgi:adenylate cyclase class IV